MQDSSTYSETRERRFSGSEHYTALLCRSPIEMSPMSPIEMSLRQTVVETCDDGDPYSPQARGRSERLFHTLRNRLLNELALAGITTVEPANRFIRDVYLPGHNILFGVRAEQEGSGFVAIPGVDLKETL